MIKKFSLFLVALSVALSLTVLGSASEDVTLTGHIVDKACSAKVAKKENPQAASADEAKDCIVRCSKSGLGIFADGKYTEFDEDGVAKAKAALEKSTKDKGAKFKVTGMIHDGKMMVHSISEVE
ncbi:MAG TPA: hypothetical protein PLD20_27255 [Blastocatellia bacterium]|nr:hypothetical protein [Blastocatellia bacterium]HMV81525.1 hypothetical protein [Blastocatellia bacterium]HMX27543.1 hypothetical protein [Blastocatellia bacterium]HMY72297.1 hypothetical protein [Blastocatellia bacterium]HMZ21661.1 hypothetical protein [Blastocatellia bacterium]